ncbi:hypothetical protein BGX28_008998 [Mortierella sp. GBA30]|nr:hypothetical protein BGX28_008998 [Mortierella sp. GBA30]
MQRGVQVLTPETDLSDIRDRDLFTSPRSSGDFSRRVSAIMAPTRSAGILQKDNPSASFSSQTAPPQITTTISTATATMSRSTISQRRISLPCIIESPTTPTEPAAPRHSCDLGRSPIYAELLIAKDGSGNAKPEHASQTQNIHPTSEALLITWPRTSESPQADSTLSQDLTHKAQLQQERTPLEQIPASSSFAVVPQAISNNTARRRSIDISAMGFFSARTGMNVRRRRSLDLLSAASIGSAAASASLTATMHDDLPVDVSRQGDSKIRRDSDASTSDTIVSGRSSCATLVNPMMQAIEDNKPPLERDSQASDKTNITASDLSTSSPMGRSISQPPFLQTSQSSGSARRNATASESGVRQSFDLRLFAGHRDRIAVDENRENHVKNRRRSIHDPLFTMKEEPDMGTLPLDRDIMASLTSTLNKKSSKHRASFSGSATVSGRLSRFLWYGSGKENQEQTGFCHGKDSSAASTGPDNYWNSGNTDPGEMQGVDGLQQDSGERKSRSGMMNRLSGIWSRR